MGEGMGLPRDRPKAETLSHVERGAFQLAVVEGKGLRLAVFQEQLAVVASMEGFGDQPFRGHPVEAGAPEEQVIGLGEG
jgi:hypothetical protein